MPDPAVSLVSAALLLLGLAALFWPIRGLVWRWRKMRQTSGRVLIEDALKHLHDNEYSEQPTSVQSLAGALGVSSNRSAKLLARIEALTLVQRNGGSIRLTADGRRDALRVIRLHRLWESYLSQETGVDATQWHDEAELREHSLSPV